MHVTIWGIDKIILKEVQHLEIYTNDMKYCNCPHEIWGYPENHIYFWKSANYFMQKVFIHMYKILCVSFLLFFMQWIYIKWWIQNCIFYMSCWPVYHLCRRYGQSTRPLMDGHTITTTSPNSPAGKNLMTWSQRQRSDFISCRGCSSGNYFGRVEHQFFLGLFSKHCIFSDWW